MEVVFLRRRGPVRRDLHAHQDINKKRKKASDDSYSEEHSKTRGSKPPSTANVNKKMADDIKKMPEDMPQSEEVQTRPMFHSGFDDRLSAKPVSGYTEPSMTIDDVSRSWARGCRRSPCFRELGTG